MTENRVACCYLTHNHPESIEHVLGMICDSYKQHGIDIYYFDSSEDDKTELIVKSYIEKGYDNIYYVDVRYIKSGDVKFFNVIQGKGLLHHYDYIWPTKDRAFLRGDTLDSVVNATKEGYDVILATEEDFRWELRIPKVKDVYTDPVEFFAHYGQLSTDWVALIRRTDTMIDTVDWDNLTKTYNLGEANPFNQTVSVFARLAELSNPRIRVVSAEPGDILYSAYSYSAWTNSIIEVWGKLWISAIYSLPSIYDAHKLEIIKSELGLPALFGSTDRLIFLRNEGVLTQEAFEELAPIWGMITDIPIKYAEYIMQSEDQKLFEEVVESLVNSFKELDYDKSYFIFKSNDWISQLLEKDTYEDLEICFKIYRDEINKKGYSVLFNQVDSIEGLVLKYRGIRDRNNG